MIGNILTLIKLHMKRMVKEKLEQASLLALVKWVVIKNNINFIKRRLNDIMSATGPFDNSESFQFFRNRHHFPITNLKLNTKSQKTEFSQLYGNLRNNSSFVFSLVRSISVYDFPKSVATRYSSSPIAG